MVQEGGCGKGPNFSSLMAEKTEQEITFRRSLFAFGESIFRRILEIEMILEEASVNV